GVKYTVVQADSGAIGGAGSEEFMVIADSGEDAILYCDESGYAANVEKAVSKLPEAPAGGEPKPMEKVSTPDVKTVAQLEAFFPGWVAGRMAKTVLYHVTWKNKEKVVAVMMRGDLEINEVKLTNALDALKVRLATDEEIKAALPFIFIGILGIGARAVDLIGDMTVTTDRNTELREPRLDRVACRSILIDIDELANVIPIQGAIRFGTPDELIHQRFIHLESARWRVSYGAGICLTVVSIAQIVGVVWHEGVSLELLDETDR
ncbi:MAG TPA: YbaK/EbsC family protein, partial [Thermomicrobiales bacterium]|nr:YbaK/EbsC family protein [Thermomicrobiales bacterium]